MVNLSSGSKRKYMQDKKRIPVREGYFYEAHDQSEASYLIGSKCRICKSVLFPKIMVCPECLKEDTMEEVALSKRGTLYTYTVLYMPIPGYPAPYIIGRTQLPEGPIITSPITGCEMKEGALNIGDDVELVIGKISETDKDEDIIGYMFRPVHN